MRYAIILLLLGCSWFNCSSPVARNAAPQDQQTIQARIGETCTVKFPSQISTGYKWLLKEQVDSTLLTLIREEFQPSKDEREDIQGYNVFTFQALKAGTAELQFWYVRPWKKDKAADPGTQYRNVKVVISGN
jgi:predicted secreted protein